MTYKLLLLNALAILGFAFTSRAQSVPAYLPTNGLVSWFPFTGNADDLSGNGNHATVNGAVLASDRFGNPNAAYSFNGSTDYLHGSASSFPTGYRTVSLWFFSTNIDVGPTGMQAFGYGGGLCLQSWLMQMDNPTPSTSFITEKTYELALGCNNWVAALPFAISSPNPNSNWHHWVITNSIAGVDFYIDGSYAGGITTPIGGTGVAGKKYFIGACPDSTGMLPYQDNYLTYWNGLLDDIAIWDRALTQQEITALYNGGAVGLSEVSDTGIFSIRPNPAGNEFNIKVDESKLGQNFTMIDIFGKIVMTKKIDETDFRIESGHLSNGMYVIYVGDDLNRSMRFIKE